MNFFDSYKILIDKKAQKIIDDLHEPEHSKIVLKIQELNLPNIQHLNIKKLQGYKNLYRIKVDSYRIVFAVISPTKTLIIAVVGHRKEVYDLVKRMKF